MSIISHRNAWLNVLLAVSHAACTRPNPPAARAPDIVLPVYTTVVSTESGLIAYPSALEIDDDGQVWIADFVNNRLLCVSPHGEIVRTLGRSGAGPAELDGPIALLVQDSSLLVVEVRNGRVQDISFSGESLATYRLLGPPGLATLTQDRRLASPARGETDALIAVHRLDNPNFPVTLGPRVVAEVSGWDFTSIRARIRDGIIPDEFRNQATPVSAVDGGFWVIVQTEAELRRYSPSGTLEWTRVLDFPEIQHARADFFRKNNEESNPAMIHTLVTVTDAQEVGSELWLMPVIAPGGQGAIYVLSRTDGSILRRLVFETPNQPNQFAVDLVRGRLYVSIPDDASLIAIPLDVAAAQTNN